MKANSHFLLKIIFKNIFTYLCAATGMPRHSCGGQEDILQESSLSFGYVSPGDQTQVIRIGSKRLHPLSLLATSQGGDSRALTALETPRSQFFPIRSAGDNYLHLEPFLTDAAAATAGECQKRCPSRS